MQNPRRRAIATITERPDALVLVYAMTIHKAQGSEYHAVVTAVMTRRYAMLARAPLLAES